MKTGSMLLIESEGFLPDKIRKFMAKYAEQTGRKPSPYNHAETILQVSDAFWNRYLSKYGAPQYDSLGRIMVTTGARESGAEVSPLKEYLDKHPKRLIREPKVDLTLDEIYRQEAYCEEICFTNKRKYQKLMFMAWILKVWTRARVQLGGQTDKLVYCYEQLFRFCKLIDKGNGQEPLISIYDHLENPHFKDL